MYSIFLDLAPILVNWSDIWEYGSQFGRIWAKFTLEEFTIRSRGGSNVDLRQEGLCIPFKSAIFKM